MTAFRPIRPDDVDVLSQWKVDPEVAGEFQWVGFGPSHSLRDRVMHDEVISSDGGSLAVIDDDGVLIGDVSWRRSQTGPAPESYCWNIGILLLPEHRGKGHGAEAQRLLADYLFDHTPANRVDADTDLDNIAEQRALEKAGFTREGVLRGAQWRQGAWRDMVLYSKLRGEK